MPETRSNDFKRFGLARPPRGGIRFALAAGALLLSPLVTFQAFGADNLPGAAPPEPPRLACQREAHGESWEDPFCGLRDDAYPEIKRQEILDYIAAENAHYDAYFERHQGLTDKLYNEFLSRLAWTNETPLVKDGPFYYFTRWGAKLSFAQYLRRHIKSGREELLLDSGERAEKFGQINVHMVLHSPDHNLVAWSEDRDGSERYAIRVRRIAEGETLDDVVPNASGQIVWAADSNRFFYLELDENSRPLRVRSHTLGTPTGSDPVLFEEADSRYLISIRSSQSGKYLFIELDGLVLTETWFLAIGDPSAKPRLITERRQGHEYFVDEAGGSFYIRTNDKHPNFRIVRTPVDGPGERYWQEVVAAKRTEFIDGFRSFKSFLLLQTRKEGVENIRVSYYRGGSYNVTLPDEYRTVRIYLNFEFNTNTVNLSYQSMLHPQAVFAFRVDRKRIEHTYYWVDITGYKAENYHSKRLWARAKDGARVPISIIYPKGYREQKDKKLFMYAYGAYGSALSPYFSPYRLSLLDRGIAYAIAHVRGGGELGPDWHAAGTYLSRKNSFEDFVAAANHLIDEGYAEKGRIAISGLSAGSTITGYVLNEYPGMWRAAILRSPFVDVLNTMLDPDLQLTPLEWNEWGNPIEDKEVFEYMQSYSPYDNIRPQNYPAVLVLSGLNDRRVTYWEPLKWVARLRTTKTSDSQLLLSISPEDAHSGSSAFEANVRRQAETGAFLLLSFGIKK